jgi:PEP-CTERM motif
MRQTFRIAAAAIFPIMALATPATALTVLTFAESGVNPPSSVLFTDNGNGTTSLVTAVGVTISAIAGPLGPTVPIADATFMLSGFSTDAAASEIVGGVPFYVQTFSGTYAVDAPECGTVCLQGTWDDVMTGPINGFALALAASDPPLNGLTMSSDTIPAGLLGIPRGMALAQTALTSPVTIDCASPLGCTLASTSANVSGTFSAGSVPEPSTWAMMLLGFAGLGYAGYRASRKSVALAA